MTLLMKAAANGTAAAYAAVPGINYEIGNATVRAVQDANISSFKLVYLVAIAFGCAAIAVALLQKGIDPAVKTNHRAVLLENEDKEKVQKAVV